MKTSNGSIVPSRKEELIISNPSQQQIEIREKLKNIDFLAKIRDLQEKLHNDVVVLEESAGPVLEQEIIQKKKILFLERIDEKATLSNMIKQNNRNIDSIKKAINRQNLRLYAIIDIIETISCIEKDIFDLIEDQSIDANELKCVLNDIFEEQGLSEDQIYSLLNSSFKRGYILRDRIATLRKEYDDLKNEFEKIHNIEDQLNKDIKDVSLKIKEIESSIVKAQNESADIKGKIELLEGLHGKVSDIENNVAQKADKSELLKYALSDNVYSKDEINGALKEKVDSSALIEYTKTNAVFTKEEVGKKIKAIWIAYGVTTAILLAGLVMSFLM